ADMSTLYLTNAVDRTRPPYPILWFMQDMNGNPLCIRYDTAHNMGFVLYDNGIWSPHNVNARDMRSAIQSIQQFWH
ncbi:hypothetical protein, partial [Xenorhabdus bovienii]|uniref:hypothetical protein n=1 Tax=Xenorhabdus bovienii TaxID=40576 RepID=UPI003DA5D6D6